MDKKVAIITARGGSKRISRKNIKEFLGYPIIKYSIDAALNAGCFDEVMVSTDDSEIAEIAKKYRANVPFMRSEKTSNDIAMTADVIEEVLLEYQKNGQNFEYACCIYPTASFITPGKLQKSFEILKENDADSVIPVVKFSYPIQRSLKIESKKLSMFHPEFLNTRSQDLEPAYHDAGQFYWLKIEAFLKQKSLFMSNTLPLEISELEVQDIDNEVDWKLAELKYKLLHNL
jgi:N-acylneuraminate cytidylyltransferase